MPITYRDKIVDRQVGRNVELFALAVGETKKTPEERYPFLRILISILEQARPEWHQSPTKDRQLAHAIFKLSRGMIPVDETAEVVRLRDMERGYLPLPEQEGSEESVDGSAQNEVATGDDAVGAAESPAGEAGNAKGDAAETTDAGATAGNTAGDDTAVVTEPVEAKAADTEAGSTEVVTENGAGDSDAAGEEAASVATVTDEPPAEAVGSGTPDAEGMADSAAEAASGEQSPEETKPRRRGRPRRNP